MYLLAIYFIHILNGYSYLVFEDDEIIYELKLAELYNKNKETVDEKSYFTRTRYQDIDDYIASISGQEGNGLSKTIDLVFKPGLVRNILSIASGGLALLRINFKTAFQKYRESSKIDERKITCKHIHEISDRPEI